MTRTKFTLNTDVSSASDHPVSRGNSTAGERAFLIKGPAVISFSGGRSSGFMLWSILRAHDGALPSDVHVIFADTGREHLRTYEFVRACAEKWSINIEWVAMDKGEHETPFDALIARKNYLPNPIARFCTTEMKIRPIEAFMKSRYESWDNVVGIRADEQARVSKMRAKDTEQVINRVPLSDAGVSEADVFTFWSRQNFDLNLPRGFSNCVGCFMKSAAQLIAIEQMQPGSLEWYATKEAEIGGTFRSDRPSYAKLIEFSNRQGMMLADEPLMECFCHD